MVKVATNGRSCRCQYAQMIDRANTAATVVLRLLILREQASSGKQAVYFAAVIVLLSQLQTCLHTCLCGRFYASRS